MDALMSFGQGVFGGVWPAVWTLIKIVLIVAPLLLGVAYLTWVERKVIGYMQVRITSYNVCYTKLLRAANGFRLVVPPPELCTDNAAMIAWAGGMRQERGLTDDLGAAARARWPLDPDAPPALGAGVKA